MEERLSFSVRQTIQSQFKSDSLGRPTWLAACSWWVRCASSVKRRAARAVFMVDEVRSSMSRWVANHVSSIARTASADNMQSHRGSHDKAVPGSTVTKTKSRSLLWVVSIEDPAVTTSR